MASPSATVLAIFFAAFLLLSGPCAAATDGQWSLTDLTMAEFDTTEDNAAQGIYEAIKDLGLLNISSACREHVEDYWDGINWELPMGDLSGTVEQLWPQRIYDAIGKFPISGVTGGNAYALGSYTSCRALNATYKDSGIFGEMRTFLGKYCYVEREQTKARPIQPSPSKAMIGVCFPDSCSDADIHLAIDHNNEMANVNAGDTLYKMIHCGSNSDVVGMDGYDSAIFALLGLFGILILIGTAYDLFIRKVTEETASEVPMPPVGAISQSFLSFSAYSSFAWLMNCGPASKEHLSSLNGIRFISFTWVLVYHFYQFVTQKVAVMNINEFNGPIQSGFLFRPVLNIFAADTFLFVSGLVLAYTTFKELDRSSGRLNPLKFYVKRYMRLTGIYVMVLNFHCTIYKYFDFGPTSSVEATVDICRDNIWKNVLYINNFSSEWGVDWCLPHTWYLDVMMQLFLVSPLVILPMWWIAKKKEDTGKGSIMAAAFAGAIVVVFTAVMVGMDAASKDWNNMMARPVAVDSAYFKDNWVMPWFRAQSYIIGIVCGYFIHLYREKELKISRLVNCALWFCAFGLGFAVAYGNDGNEARNAGEDPSAAMAVIYDSFSRITWSLALCWVVFACEKGYGGVVNSFLTWEAFGPLSRMTLVLYLLHFSVMDFLLAQITYSVNFGHFLGSIQLSTILVVLILVSTAVSTLIEIPLKNIQKWVLDVIGSVFSGKKTD